MTYPDGDKLGFEPLSTGGLHDVEAARVTQVSYIVGLSTTPIMDYDYNGLASLVGQDYLEPDARWNLHEGGTTGDPYPDVDRFGRITSSRWTGYKNGGTRDFYDVDLSYDRNSNIVDATDNVHSGFDVLYGVDNLNRVNDAEEGTLSAGSITSRTRHQTWTMSQVGAFTNVQLDLDGDDNWNETGEYDDDRTFTLRNELKDRDTNASAPVEYTLTHDNNGHLTDDGKDYDYEYDVFGRLRKVKDRSSAALVAEYRYNGLGHRIGWHYDVTDDGTNNEPDGVVDGNDPWYYFVYDDGWRVIATYRGSDSDPKERFFYHAAGLNGFGGSSYIDATILRDRDDDTAWYAAADGTMEQRRFAAARGESLPRRHRRLHHREYATPDGLGQVGPSLDDLVEGGVGG